MNLCNSEQEYLDQIIEPARRCCKRYGYLPSVLIAQSALENGYAIAKYFDNPQLAILIEKNNGVGIKRELINKSWTDIGLSVWQGEYIRKNTPEQYGNQMVTIKDDFRVYDCMERSFADFLCFLTWASNYGPGGKPKYGREVLDIKDPTTLIKTVGARGYATGQTYPTSVMRIVNKHNLTKYDNLDGVEPTIYYPEKAKQQEHSSGDKKEEVKPVGYTNSSLVNITKLSPCNSGTRNHAIDRITPHCVVGQLDAATIGACFDHASAQASCNYGIGADLKIVMCVPESQRSWCSSSSANDNRAVTIECACDKTHPYAFKETVYQKLIELCTDICRRNGKSKLLWFGNKEQTLNYNPASNEMVLTVHRWFANKACPGDWMMARMGDLATKVTQALGGDPTPVNPPTPTDGVIYKVQLGAYKNKSNAEMKLRQVTSAGFDAFITDLQDGYYRVQVGAYSIKQNALNKLYAVNNAGFNAILKEYKQ